MQYEGVVECCLVVRGLTIYECNMGDLKTCLGARLFERAWERILPRRIRFWQDRGANSPASNSILGYAEGAPTRRALLHGGCSYTAGTPTRRALLRGGRSYAEGAPSGGGSYAEGAPMRRALLRGGRSYAEGAPTRRAFLRGGRSYAEGAPTRLSLIHI